MQSTAYKVNIEDLIRGRYVRGDEGEPNYLITSWGQKVLRTNLIATVVEKFIRDDGGYATLLLDDGTETIRVKAWSDDVEKLEKFDVGHLVKVIGKIREYEGEIHLVSEVIRRVDNPNWELVRKLEILIAKKNLLAEGKYPEPRKDIEGVQEGGPEPYSGSEARRIGTIEKLGEASKDEITSELKDKLLLALDKLEGENGATSTDLAAELDISQSKAEDALAKLLNEDEIYEPEVGRFRRLR